jgi:excisionase family DNA binding protein
VQTKAPANRRRSLPQFISRQQAAGMIGMTVQYIDKILAQGHIAKHRFGHSVRIRLDEFLMWIEANREVQR